MSDEARRTVVLAQEEARELGHRFVGAPHLVLGALAGGEPMRQGPIVRTVLVEALGPGEPHADQSGHMPFTPGAKHALERSLRIAMASGRNDISRRTLLLALLDIPEVAGPLAGALDLDGLRADMAADPPPQPGPPAGDTPTAELLRQILARLAAIEARLDRRDAADG